MSTTVPTCSICGKTFKNNQGLMYHSSHYVCQKFTCSYCGRRFKSSLGLDYHTRKRICLPAEKIPVTIIAKSHYHTYTLPRTDIKLRDIMHSVDGNFGDHLFEADNIILKFIELALANPKLDQYWSCYISNRREPYLTTYDGSAWVLQPQALENIELGKWALEKISRYLHDNKAVVKRSYWTKFYITKDQFERKTHAIHKVLKQGLFCLFVNQKNMLIEKGNDTCIKFKP